MDSGLLKSGLSRWSRYLKGSKQYHRTAVPIALHLVLTHSNALECMKICTTPSAHCKALHCDASSIVQRNSSEISGSGKEPSLVQVGQMVPEDVA